MANTKTLEQARRAARERLAQAQRERAEREGKSVDDAAEVIRARTRVGEVDAWEAERIAAVAVEADRKRAEHHAVAAAAVARMRSRGESIKTIALLADLSEGHVRKYLRDERHVAPVPMDASSSGDGAAGALSDVARDGALEAGADIGRSSAGAARDPRWTVAGITSA